jgi:hypothetical protein
LNRFVKARFESARDIRSGVSRTNWTIYLAGQTGIEANGKVAEGFRTEAARRAKMPFPIHPHMLRHGCGYPGANPEEIAEIFIDQFVCSDWETVCVQNRWKDAWPIATRSLSSGTGSK